MVSLLKSRDSFAFGYLYDNYSGALFSVILKVISDRELAEDILQEAFVKIWNNFQSYEPGKGRLFTWMLHITRNLTIDTLRGKSYKKQSKVQLGENSVNQYRSNIRIEDSFDALGIRKHVNLLKEDQQQVIDLAYFEGFTQKEISEKLNVPLGTVKSRMRTAIQELKKIIVPNH